MPNQTRIPIQAVRRGGCDLGVMGALTRAGVAGLISGSEAVQNYRAANGVVMVIKPPAFVLHVAL